MAKKEKIEIVEEEVTIMENPPELSANVAFVGKAPWKPLVNVQTAEGLGFNLSADQSEPFYHEKAGFLIRTFPHLYKPVKQKGVK